MATFYKYPRGTPILPTTNPPIFNASDNEPRPNEIPFDNKKLPRLDKPDNKDPFANIFELDGII